MPVMSAPPIATPSSTVPRRFVEGISAQTPYLEAVESCFRQRWNAVLYYLARVVDRKEPLADQIHRLRVSSRRFQALLESLPETFPAKRQQRLLRLARKIRRTGERARALEVRRAFLEQLLPTVSLEEAAAVELICERTLKRRNQAHKKLLRKAPGLAARLIKTGQQLLAELKAADLHPDDFPTFVEAGSLAISRQLDALWNQAARDHESPESLHQLRLAGKRLRYTMELFLPILDRTFRDDFLPQLEHIQDLLGDFHDAVEAQDRLQKQHRKWKQRFPGGVRKQNRFGSVSWDGFRSGLDTISLACEQQAEHARTEFRDLWPGFSGESFRVPIEHSLARTFAECEAETTCRINILSPIDIGSSIESDVPRSVIIESSSAAADENVPPAAQSLKGPAE